MGCWILVAKPVPVPRSTSRREAASASENFGDRVKAGNRPSQSYTRKATQPLTAFLGPRGTVESAEQVDLRRRSCRFSAGRPPAKVLSASLSWSSNCPTTPTSSSESRRDRLTQDPSSRATVQRNRYIGCGRQCWRLLVTLLDGVRAIARVATDGQPEWVH